MMNARLLIAALFLFTTPAAAVVVHHVPMSDGTSLYTRVYLPGDDEGTPRPVIMVRTPYGAAAAVEGNLFDLLQPDHAWLNARGYAVVAQDVRGTGESDGEDVLRFLHDAADTDETLAWVAAQDWSNGRVALWGPSALGINALLALQRAPPELSCVLDLVATADVREAFYPGGAFREEMAAGWLPEHSSDTALDIFRQQEVDSAFWDEGRLSDDEIADTPVKTMTIAGTFDVFGPMGARVFSRLAALGRNQTDHMLVLGPWTHSGYVPTHQADLAGAFNGELKFPVKSFFFPGQYLDPAGQFSAFMNWCLNDAGRPGWANVRVFRFWLRDEPEFITNLTTDGGWQEYETWPPATATATPMFLYDDGGLGTAPDPGGLGRQLISHPDDPVPTVGGARLIEAGEGNGAGPRNQNMLIARNDVLTYVSAPATGQVELVGNLRAEVYAATSTNDIDVHVKFAVQRGEGPTYLLADGVRRGRFLDGEDAIVPLEPGQARRFEVDIGPVAFLLRAGQRLVVMIQATNHDRFDINPQHAAPIADDPVAYPAALTVYGDMDRPSAIYLPLISGELPGAEAPVDHADAGPDPMGPVWDGGFIPEEPEPSPEPSPEPEPQGDGNPAPAGCTCVVAGVPAPAGGLALVVIGALARRRRRPVTPSR